METNEQTAGKHAEPGVACSATLDRGRHTPGPWTTDERYPGNVYCDDATGSLVANCGPHKYVFRAAEERAANAALIAAAPELLDALRAVRLEAHCMAKQMNRAGWHVPENGAVMRAIRAADAAIAKATTEAAA